MASCRKRIGFFSEGLASRWKAAARVCSASCGHLAFGVAAHAVGQANRPDSRV
jgi:hypothetical protein